MILNMGTADRVIRTLIAVAIGVLYVTKAIGGTVAIVLGVFALLLLLTSLVSFCPGYLPFGLTTAKKPPAQP
jgi:hypothetical protein